MSTLCRAAQWQKYAGADLPAVADLYAIVAAATADAAQVGTSENPFFCQTHLSAFLKGGRPPVQFRRSQSQSVAVIRSLKWRDHPPSQHLPGVKPLKGRVKEGRKISDFFWGSATVLSRRSMAEADPVAVRGVSRRTSGQRRGKVSQSGSNQYCGLSLAAKSYANAFK